MTNQEEQAHKVLIDARIAYEWASRAGTPEEERTAEVVWREAVEAYCQVYCPRIPFVGN